MKPKPSSYWVRQYCPTRWEVIAPDGHPVYDGAPFGNDKPLLFSDPDKAEDFAEKCNLDNSATDCETSEL